MEYTQRRFFTKTNIIFNWQICASCSQWKLFIESIHCIEREFSLEKCHRSSLFIRRKRTKKASKSSSLFGISTMCFEYKQVLSVHEVFQWTSAMLIWSEWNDAVIFLFGLIKHMNIWKPLKREKESTWITLENMIWNFLRKSNTRVCNVSQGFHNIFLYYSTLFLSRLYLSLALCTGLSSSFSSSLLKHSNEQKWGQSCRIRWIELKRRPCVCNNNRCGCFECHKR